jgi:hypothetical protein
MSSLPAFLMTKFSIVGVTDWNKFVDLAVSTNRMGNSISHTCRHRVAVSLGGMLLPPANRAGWTGLENFVCQKSDRGFWTFFLASWIGLACNWLLPVAQIGGELVKARLLAKPNKDIEPWATMVIDKTFQVLTQICFASPRSRVVDVSSLGQSCLYGGGFAMLILLVDGYLPVADSKTGLVCDVFAFAAKNDEAGKIRISQPLV